jgi:hypothetical protein
MMPELIFLLHCYKNKMPPTPVQIQHLEHIHFCTAEHIAGTVAHLPTPQGVHLQQVVTHALNLPDKSLHPAYYTSDMILVLRDANTHFINRFGFLAYQYLVWEDGDVDQAVSEGCVCGDWLFFAYSMPCMSHLY